MRKILLFIITFFGILIGTSSMVAASTVDTPDWSTIASTSVGYNGKGTFAVTGDSTNVYFHVDMGGMVQDIPTNNYYLVIGTQGYTLSFSAASGSTTISAIGSGTNWQTINNVGTATIISNSTVRTIDGQLSLKALNIQTPAVTQDLNFSDSGLGSEAASGKIVPDSTQSSSSSTATTSSTTTSSSTDSSSTSSSENAASQALAGSSDDQASSDSTQATNNNTSENLGIKIDGDFSDWADKTLSDMYISGDQDNLKKAALLADNKNVYFYVAMMPKLGNGSTSGYATFQASGYQLNVGGIIYDISFNNNSTVTLDVGQKQAVSVNVYNEKTGADSTFDDDAYVANQELTQKNGQGESVQGNGYVLECAIPFSVLGSSSDTSGQTITLANSNLWTGKLQTTGGSTGPVLLAGTGFIIALFFVIVLPNKKRRKNMLKEIK